MNSNRLDNTDTYDVLICGGGLVGLTAAYALLGSGHTVCLVAPKSASTDPRTTAILHDSVEYLKDLGIWDENALATHPLKTMRLVDATSRLFRFSQTDFNSTEIGLEAFGVNVKNQDLLDRLEAKLDGKTNELSRFSGTLTGIRKNQDGVICAQVTDVKGTPHTISTRFIVGADGRNSFVRSHFGSGERQWNYPQSAIVLDFEHQHSSRYTSTEFHTETGPFTIVPQSDHVAGLVWLEKPEIAEQIAKQDILELGRILEDKMGSWLGKVTVLTKPHTFDMKGMNAKIMGDHDYALIGEAAHVFPPIGAQGFNLGVRDIKDLCTSLSQFTNLENRGLQYHRARQTDVVSRTFGVDLLNRSLLSDFIPVQLMKSAGIFALGGFAPLRRQAMKSGISPIAFSG